MGYKRYSSQNKSSILKFNLQILFLLVLLFTFSCSTSKRFESNREENFEIKDKLLRVLITVSKRIKIELENESDLIDFTGKRISIKENSSVQFLVTSIGVKCLFNNKEVHSKEFAIIPKSNKYLSFNDKKYRGFLKVVSDASSLKVVNYVNLEDYVKGVILKEMPLEKGKENFEALKAFSVLVRTYALKKKLESNELFDLYQNTRDQLYGGMNSENEITNSIVELTRGQILSFDDKIATVFYHSTCGGYTENVENVFKSYPLPYLISKKDGSPENCIISPRFLWEESLSENLIIKRLLESNYITSKNSKIEEIEITKRFNSGRINELKITVNENGKLREVYLYSNNIRFALKNSKGNILPSSNFNIQRIRNNIFKLDGKGFGHGVGLCQMGSSKLSKEGINFKEILNFYFPKTEIKQLYD